MQWMKAFVAGFLATLVFHQGLLGVFYLTGLIPHAPYNLAGVPPWGVPAVLSLAFFGGLWGLPAWALIRRQTAAAFWGLSVVFGAIAPTVVAMLIVFPLKGLDVTAKTWIGGLMLNGAWGLGVALFMTWMGARRATD
ncbi:hypothetical protein QQM79_08540 [Marinobacteraceae bacterium S3BR75-40.1]